MPFAPVLKGMQNISGLTLWMNLTGEGVKGGREGGKYEGRGEWRTRVGREGREGEREV